MMFDTPIADAADSPAIGRIRRIPDQRPLADQPVELPADQPAQPPPADQPAQPPPAPPRHSRRFGRWRGIAVAVVVVLAIGGLVATAVIAAVTGRLDRLPLLNPTVAITVEALAGLALVGSWISRRRRWLTRWLPAIVLSAAAVTGIAAAVLRLTGTVTDAYPAAFALWVGMAL